jgi:hypothetical protein
MNPRAEAQERVPPGHEARVLEPSPPAVAEGPWFADDPVARGDAAPGARVVSPVSTGDVSWEQMAAGDPELETWCAERWLAAWPRLEAAPAQLEATRRGLHAIAEHVMKPARERANGKFGLRFTRGGFGTPFFAADVQVRAEGAELVVLENGAERRAPITTLGAAADLLGSGLLERGAEHDGRELAIDPEAAAFVAAWFGFAYSVLEELRAEADLAHEPSRVQIWPEHFDAALELGAESSGFRAAYGCSPGDENHREPYCYVAPWSARIGGDLWQATGFSGAELSFPELLAAEDQRGLAREFFETRLVALVGPA